MQKCRLWKKTNLSLAIVCSTNLHTYKTPQNIMRKHLDIIGSVSSDLDVNGIYNENTEKASANENVVRNNALPNDNKMMRDISAIPKQENMLNIEQQKSMQMNIILNNYQMMQAIQMQMNMNRILDQNRMSCGLNENVSVEVMSDNVMKSSITPQASDVKENQPSVSVTESSDEDGEEDIYGLFTAHDTVKMTVTLPVQSPDGSN